MMRVGSYSIPQRARKYTCKIKNDGISLYSAAFDLLLWRRFGLNFFIWQVCSKNENLHRCLIGTNKKGITAKNGDTLYKSFCSGGANAVAVLSSGG